MKKMVLLLMAVVSVSLCGCSANSKDEGQGIAEAALQITDGTEQGGTGQSGIEQGGTEQSGIEQGAAGQNNMEGNNRTAADHTEEPSGQDTSAAGNMADSPAKTLQDGSLPDAYKEILDSVYEVILGKEAGDVEGGELLSPGVQEVHIGRTTEEVLSHVGYTLYDVDGNGVKELIVADIREEMYDSRILNMYTIQEDKPVTIIDGWARNRYYILNDGRIYNEGSGGSAYNIFATYRVGADGCSLELIDYYFSDYKDKDAFAVGEVSWFHNTTGEGAVEKSELMEWENDEELKLQEEFEAQVMPLELTVFSDYR